LKQVEEETDYWSARYKRRQIHEKQKGLEEF